MRIHLYVLYVFMTKSQGVPKTFTPFHLYYFKDVTISKLIHLFPSPHFFSSNLSKLSRSALSFTIMTFSRYFSRYLRVNSAVGGIPNLYFSRRTSRISASGTSTLSPCSSLK